MPEPTRLQWPQQDGPDNPHVIITRAKGKVVNFSLVNGLEAAEQEWGLHAEGDTHSESIWLCLGYHPHNPQLIETRENGVPVVISCHAWGCHTATAKPNLYLQTCAKCGEQHWFCKKCSDMYIYPTGHQQGPFRVHPLACANRLPKES